MNRITGFLMSTCAAVLVGCATSAAGPAAAPAAAPAAVPAASVAAKPAATAAAAATPDTVKIPYGYVKIVLDNGEMRYCRNDLVPNSRVEHNRVCLTAEQLKASQDNSQNFIDSVQQHGGASTMNGTPGAGGAMGH
jgi:hypothetical protein